MTGDSIPALEDIVPGYEFAYAGYHYRVLRLIERDDVTGPGAVLDRCEYPDDPTDLHQQLIWCAAAIPLFLDTQARQRREKHEVVGQELEPCGGMLAGESRVR